MPGRSTKPHRIRVRADDGKPREWNKLKGRLGAHLDVIDVKDKVEFIVCGVKQEHIDQVRTKLQDAGLEVIVGGDTTVPAAAEPRPAPQQRPQGARTSNGEALLGKPYGFVALPEVLESATPIWHDGTSSKERLSGEIRCELETLTPMLVGWERGQVGDRKIDWPVPANLAGVGPLADRKSVLCPLRAPWGTRPVIIPGDSLKGLLRHELGALLGAPMERVAERSYSYRPNALFPRDPNPRLIARLARVPDNGFEMKVVEGDQQVRVPTKLELLPTDLRYDKERVSSSNYYRFDDRDGAPYRGGLGAGQRLNSKKRVHPWLKVPSDARTETVDVPQTVQDGYLSTVRHLASLDHGHFSERHPDVPNIVTGDAARSRILKAAKDEVFQPGDMIWVEWDTEERCIVSLGWHYYYRWAYTDSIRKDADAPRHERRGLFPLDTERQLDGAEDDKHRPPHELSLIRRLFGYTGDNEGSAGIGKNDHAQLMGRVFVNAGLEVVGESDTDEHRFLGPTFLKELGMPRPSAVEHYLKQPHHPRSRPSDRATLATYGDADGYDSPGELAGRKFYLDRPNAVAEDSSATKGQNDRSTLALEASRPGRKFRFTVRFRDLDAAELAAIFVALCPNQFRSTIGGTHVDGYCSKLGYARPLGWGSANIEAKQFLLLDEASESPTLKPEADIAAWVMRNHQKTPTQDEWLAMHRRNHPDAADYPRRDGEIYTYHTSLRAEHSRNRRYKKEDSR
jgi:CRISPR-associated protein (TIGR03986 family)